MNVLRGNGPFSELSAGSVATIGNFDGVHVGHQALIQVLREQARALKLPLLVILFEPQPSEYFHLTNPPARLSSLREKILGLKKLGVDYVYCMAFDQMLATMDPIEFVQRFLLSILHVKLLVVGQDFRFGKNREGDVGLLTRLFKVHGRNVQLFSDFQLFEERVSSTKIRAALAEDDLLLASKLLGRAYSMCGRVVKGDQRGRQWGIPTANINLSKKKLPIRGVYFVHVVRNGTLLHGVANVGCRPTVDGSKNILEVHILDFNQSLYGELLEVVFLQKLRDEQRFSSLDDLITTIKSDIAAAIHYFNS
ncbi:bifunctional riboflavin kinase/FAD synthetase [Legionella impletisoli]|uniref:Riboflavin biosynthesis protein n=1 Tax=Legionella impletisoli TaxID=343510 RepID=A0A917JXF1_9GAMM|nr:bifunctional riboflavin kinase/FAD synthetase [Legionella impletisoli]GGI91063.1 riboflavin biosynthesis protein [Legionella impletisoli]